jgi:hypothetical protein
MVAPVSCTQIGPDLSTVPPIDLSAEHHRPVVHHVDGTPAVVTVAGIQE